MPERVATLKRGQPRDRGIRLRTRTLKGPASMSTSRPDRSARRRQIRRRRMIAGIVAVVVIVLAVVGIGAAAGWFKKS